MLQYDFDNIETFVVKYLHSFGKVIQSFDQIFKFVSEKKIQMIWY
jgi:hypothetical protein